MSSGILQAGPAEVAEVAEVAEFILGPALDMCARAAFDGRMTPDVMIVHRPEPTLLKQAFDLRRIVFVVEQGVPEALELDEHEATAHHLIVQDPDGSVIATGRMRLLADAACAKLERIAVRAERRGEGHGIRVVRELERAAQSAGATLAKLGSQVSAIRFYERLGYQANGPVFDDAGIDHRTMTKPLGASS